MNGVDGKTIILFAGANGAGKTTLSGRSQIKWLKDARSQGYKIVLYYIHTGDVGINLERVKQRVIQGGHDVPEEDIRRRYTRSLENLFGDYSAICDRIIIYDSSESSLLPIAGKTKIR